MKKSLMIFVMTIVLGTGLMEAQPYFRNRGGNGYRVQPRETYFRNDSYSQALPYYKGFLEMGYSFGVGDNRSDRLDFLTTHGLQLTESAFLGVGTGLSVSFNADGDYVPSSDYDNTGVGVPLYVDLRLMQPSWQSSVQPFFDLKVGMQFTLDDDNVAFEDGYIDGSRSFYLSPTVGIRIPTGYKSALNLGVTYNLTNYRICDWYHPEWDSELKGLSSVGVKISYEW